MRVVVALVTIIVLGLGTTACSGSADHRDPGASGTPTPTAPRTGIPSAAVPLTTPLASGSKTTTIQQIKPNFSNGQASYQPANRSLRWLGVRVRTCAAAGVDPGNSVGWFQFTAVDSHGNWYPALTWRGHYPLPTTEWPLPLYPSYSQVLPGECAAGWLLIPVPKNAQITRLVYQSVDQGPQGAWRLQ